MARIRSVKPEYWSDATIATFDYFTRLFYIALWNFADDEGRGRALCRELAGFAFPLDDDLPNSEVERALQALANAGRIVLYESSGIRHFQILKFNEHQNINRPTASRLPAPSVSTHGVLTEPSSEKVDRNQESVLLGDSSFRSESVRNQEFGADAPPETEEPPPTEIVVRNGNSTKPPTADVWEAYRAAYSRRYGTDPVRNAKVNGQVSQLVSRLGAEAAAAVAGWFLTHRGGWYCQQKHSVGCLLHDCEKLHTEWRTSDRASPPTDGKLSIERAAEAGVPDIAKIRARVTPFN